MSTKVPESQRAFGPDLIRATAIVLVLLAHTFPGGTMFPVLGAARYYWGFLGVEIFFLLSGYLIGGILMAELFAGRLDSFGGTVVFWKRRWFRTLPNYYLFLGLLILLNPLVEGHFPPGVGRFFWFGQALVWRDPEFFAGAWSLAIEEWFYLLFPVALFLFSRLMSRRQHALLATIVVFLVVPVIIRSLISPATGWDDGVRRVTLPRLDAIGYGVVLAFLKNYHVKIWRLMARLWPLGLLAILGLIVHFCHHVSVSGYFTSDSIGWRAFYFCLVSFTLALAFPGVTEMAAPAGWPAVVVRKLSLWSYSIYLSHFFFSGVCALCLRRMGSLHGFESAVGGLMIWLTAIPASAFIYTYFEKPLMNLRDRPLKSIFARSR